MPSSPSSADPSVVEKWVNRIIAEKPVLMIAKTTCGYCRRAEDALSSHTNEYTVVHIDLMKWEIMDEIQTQMKNLTGSRSVPRVFIGHKFFGDSSATVAASKSGELERALREAGVSAH